MSAAGRGAEREQLDGYYTPEPLAQRIVEQLYADGYLYPHDRVLEPSVGRGAFVKALMQHMGPQIDIDACDLRLRKGMKKLWAEAGKPGTLHRGNFLRFPNPHEYHLILGNPPFDAAESHIRHALGMLGRGGALAFLLRMSFLAGLRRGKSLYMLHPLDAVYALDKRPSFDVSLRCPGGRRKKCGWKRRYPAGDKHPRECPACGQKLIVTTTDATDYGVFVWSREDRRRPTDLRQLQWGDAYDYWKAKQRKLAQKKAV